jgi:tetratricopeptide (TPR) repeat protein
MPVSARASTKNGLTAHTVPAMADRDRRDDETSFAETLAPGAPAANLATDLRMPAPTGRATLARSPGGDATALPTIEQELYALDDEIARGGMGRILAAFDRRLGRAVAVKELLGIGVDAEARFRREALITARLQHPAIVPVYEAGQWPSGEPFFAMKLVAGRPLDQVVAACQALDDRLALLPSMIAVCDAIAYAHSQRIVHRDLKPSNVLVGDFGETVVIDWGLAKDLDRDDAPPSSPAPRSAADAALTIAGAVMGTPAYMPPEQARGESVDQRADVFSLGAMLYHLLAGAPPYDARTGDDVIAAAITGKVAPLGPRAPRAPADLIAIVERAMAHEPTDRYPTARELAEELRRFQTGQLVGAHRYTAWERLVRLVRRHRAAVTIGAIAVIGFAIGGALAVHRIVAERDRAEAARHLADRRRAAAERLVDFMVSDMRDRLDAVGKLALMSGLGENVRDYYADLAELPGGMAPADGDRMARALAILGAAAKQSGDFDTALATLDDARARLRDLIAREPHAADTPRRRGALGAATLLAGQIYQARGDNTAALAAYRDAAASYADARADAPRDRDLLRGAADAHDRIGDILRNRGAPDDAIRDYERARSLRQDALELAGGDDPDVRFDLATSAMKLGSAEQNRGQTRAAIEHYRAAVAIRGAVAAAAPGRVAFQHGVAYIRYVLADLLRETGGFDEARAAYEASLGTLEQLVVADPANAEWRRDRGTVLANLGLVLYDLGDVRGALGRYQDALDNHAPLVARDARNASWQVDVSRTLTRKGDAHLHLGEVADALAAHREARRIRAALVARDGRNLVWRRALAGSEHKLAGVLPYAGELDAALAAAREARALREALVAEAPHVAAARNELATSEMTLGRLEHRAGRRDDAVAHLDRAVELCRAGVAADPDNLEWKESLASALVVRADVHLPGDLPAAAADAAEALALAEVATASGSPSWEVIAAEASWALARAEPANRDAHRRAAAGRLAALVAAGRLGHEKRDLARAVGVSTP